MITIIIMIIIMKSIVIIIIIKKNSNDIVSSSINDMAGADRLAQRAGGAVRAHLEDLPTKKLPKLLVV